MSGGIKGGNHGGLHVRPLALQNTKSHVFDPGGVLQSQSGHGFEHQSGITARAGDRTRVVERPRERKDTAQIGQTIAWFKARNATVRRWNPNRTARVRANGGKAQACRHGGRGTTARATGGSVEIIRVVRLSVISMHDTKRKLEQIGLANQHRARFLKPCCDDRVVLGHLVAQDSRPAGGPNPCGVN